MHPEAEDAHAMAWRWDLLDPSIRAALEEDIGSGDVTTEAVCPAPRPMQARIVAKQEGVAAGLPLAERVFHLLDPACAWEARAADGSRVTAGTLLALVRGPDRVLLAGERTALNYLQRLSGIATLTARFVAEAAGFPARIMDTRKTTPGWRRLEKYAVRMGGGTNHRFGLDDQVLIKENHVLAAGGVAAAVQATRAHTGKRLTVEVEVETLEELDEALAAGADLVLLDDMSLEELREAVHRTGGRAGLEASGSMRLERIRAVVATGVDRISVGALTHSAPAMDIALYLEEEPGR